MFFDREMVYSKRYPSPMEELEKLRADKTLPVINEAQIKASFQDFCSLMSSEPYYEPIPGREEKAQEFMALAKKFSEEHEIDIDIRRTLYSVEASLHFYCTAYPKDMTRQFAQLLNLCDNLSSYILKSEPSDFTLVLKLGTHKFYLADTLMNDY